MDNFYKDCPPVMSDGRHFTDYKSAVRRNEYIKYINTLYRDDEYRLFLQDNANKILDNVWNYHKKNTNCWKNACVHVYPTRSIPRHFAEERMAYDQIHKVTFPPANHVKRSCMKYNDFRATLTK
jgi:hypothetical protein